MRALSALFVLASLISARAWHGCHLGASSGKFRAPVALLPLSQVNPRVQVEIRQTLEDLTRSWKDDQGLGARAE